MIRLRLTQPMQALATEQIASDLHQMGPESFDGLVEAISFLAFTYDKIAASEGHKGRARATAKHAAKRCRDAIAKDSTRAIHVSIPVDEQEAIANLARWPDAEVLAPVGNRLIRRELVDCTPDGLLVLTARGRALAAGTPPGDLVPFAHFTHGVRVELAADLVLEDSEIRAGELFTVLEAKNGRVTVYDGALQLAACHPRIFNVLRGTG